MNSLVRGLLSFIYGGIAGALLIAVIWAVMWLFRLVRVTFARSQVQPRDRQMSNPLLLFVFASLEELFARVLLIGWLRHFIGLPIAFTVSALIFALLHIPNGKVTFLSFTNLLASGVLFGITYLRFGLWAAIGMHYAWNLMQWPILGYPMYARTVGRRIKTTAVAPEWLSGGEFGPEYSVLALVGMLGYIGLLLFR